VSERSHSQPNRSLDDRLAEFADQVLSGQMSSPAGLDDEDEEMRSLAQMVMRLDRAIGSDQPSPEMAERVRARLTLEWQKTHPNVKATAAEHGWWQRFTQRAPSSHRQQQVFAFALVAVTVVVLTIVMLSPLSGGGTLSGTAEGGGSVPILAAVLGMVLLGALFWLSRRRP
jgi:MYXO-CTERM domain-containing protein